MALNKNDIISLVGEWVVLISNDETNKLELNEISTSCPTQIRQYSGDEKYVLTRVLTEEDVLDLDFCQYLVSVWDSREKLKHFIDTSEVVSEVSKGSHSVSK